MNIVTNTFKTFLKQKLCDYLFFLLHSIVFQISYVFLCFCKLCILLFFIWNCLSITVILTKIKANNILSEPKINFYPKKRFSMFCTQTQKIPKF